MLSQEERKSFIMGYIISTLDDNKIPNEPRRMLLEKLSDPICAEMGLLVDDYEKYFKFWRELNAIGKMLGVEIRNSHL